MNARKWLWVSIFNSFLLFVALIYFSYHLFGYKNLAGGYASANKYDEYVQKISSMDDAAILKKYCIVHLEIEKIEATTTYEYVNYWAWTSTQILLLACLSWIAWFFYVRAVQKERKSLPSGRVER